MDTHSLLVLTALAVTSFALSFYGAAVGLILGHLRLPLLIYYLGSTTGGMATNLAISGLGALTGSVRHAREGRVSWTLILFMGVPSVIGAAIGAMFLLKIDSFLVHLILGGFLVISGLNLFFTRPVEGQEAHPFERLRLCIEAAIGLVIGFLTAITGLMLGSLRLPMMMRFLKVQPAIAIGSNMTIGCLTAFAGALSMSPRGEFHWLPLLIVAPPTILGASLGAKFTGNFRKEFLQRMVGATIALVGLGMALEGLWNRTV